MPSARHLMCSPDHFTVAYVINPWMEGNVHDTVSCIAMQQWSALHAIVGQFTEVALLPPVPGLPDLVFTANAAVLRGRTAILSSFLYPERQAEEPSFRAWLAQDGFEVHELPRNVPFEGAGDALFDRALPLLWFGHGVRSRPDARPYLERLLGTDVQPLELARSHFYHLDTCFCPLEGGFLLYYPAAFHSSSLQAIESIIPSNRRLAVGQQDALDFACNAINIDQHVILNRASEPLQDWLTDRGFTVHQTPTTEFLKAGGSAKCLSLSLNEN